MKKKNHCPLSMQKHIKFFLSITAPRETLHYSSLTWFSLKFRKCVSPSKQLFAVREYLLLNALSESIFSSYLVQSYFLCVCDFWLLKAFKFQNVCDIFQAVREPIGEWKCPKCTYPKVLAEKCSLIMGL